jgi:CRISPR system Cascade subunit CasA
VWLEGRADLTERFSYPAERGPALLWLLPWDGKESLPLETCDPFFIEVARRVRLVRRGEGIQALVGNTEAARVEAKAATGNTGDIWTPVTHDGKALTVGRGGLRYDKLSEVMFGEDYAAKPALVVRAGDGREPILVASVLARGQGKTEGYHERVLPIPENARKRLSDPSRRKELGELARDRVQQAKDVERRVLHPALCALLQGGEAELKMKEKRTEPWVNRLDAAIDREFFEALFRDSDLDVDSREASARWQRTLLDLAHEQLEDASRSAPVPLARRPRAIAVAERTFRRTARSRLPLAFTDPTVEPVREEPNP